MNRGLLLLLVVGVVASVAAQTQLTWRPHRGLQSDPWPAIACDEGRNRLVMPGTGARAGTVFEWDGENWFERQSSVGPTFALTLQRPEICYDDRRRVAFLFGAGSGADESWVWDGVDWQRLQPALSPPGRLAHRMCFDTVRGEVVLFGGLSRAGEFVSETWTWDGVRWQAVVGTVPPARYRHAMTFDRARGETIVFGGFGDTSQGPYMLADTWAFAAGAWRRVTTTGPSARYGPSAAFDRTSGTVTLFGGRNSFSLADTWEWDGATWRQVNTPNAPSLRIEAAMVESPRGGAPLLYGGNDYTFALSDMWQRSAAGWSRVHDELTPTIRTYTALAYDLARRSTVLFGGRLHDLPLGDTWVRSSGTWQKRQSATSPPARAFAAMAYDLGRARSVLFGGVGLGLRDDTWEWDGVTWREATPSVRPPRRELHAMTWDPVTARVLLFGGQGSGNTLLGDTWAFDGSNWTAVAATGPSPRVGAGIATDLTRLEVLLFGGAEEVNGSRSVVGDTWRWNGSVWARLAPLATPGSRSFAALAYDWRTGDVLLHGGSDGRRGAPSLSDSWVWNGSIWAPAAVQGAQRLAAHALVFDVDAQEFLTGFGLDFNLIRGESAVITVGPTSARTSYGAGCGAALELAADDALPGRPMALELRGAQPAAPVLFLWSTGRANVPIGGGCALLVTLPALSQMAVANASGVAFAPTELSWSPALRGAVLTAQAATIDGGGGPWGLSISRGLECRLGN